MEEILLKLRKVLGGVTGLTDNFDAWKTPWTPARAGKIDNLDATVKSRASAADYTSERAEKLDHLDIDVSSRASQEIATIIHSNVGDATSRNLDTVMGRLGSIIGYGQEVVYDQPGTYTFTVPAGVVKISVVMIGAGGGSGGSGGGTSKGDATASRNLRCGSCPGGNGGAGGYISFVMDVMPGAQHSIVIGAGGNPGSGGVYNTSGGGVNLFDHDQGTTKGSFSQGGSGTAGYAGGATSFGGVFISGAGGGAGGDGALSFHADSSSYVSSGATKTYTASCGASGVANHDADIKNIIKALVETKKDSTAIARVHTTEYIAPATSAQAPAVGDGAGTWYSTGVIGGASVVASSTNPTPAGNAGVKGKNGSVKIYY